MKSLIVTLFISCLGFLAEASTTNCNLVKIGMSPENDHFIDFFLERTNSSPYQGKSQIEEIVRAGFQGEIFAFAGPHYYGREIQIPGYYLKVSNIEASLAPEPMRPLYSDTRLHALMKERNDVPYFVRSDFQYWGFVPIYPTDDFRGQMSRCALNQETQGPFVVLTPDSDYYVLRHELVHYDDAKAGLPETIRKRLSDLENNLTPDEKDNVSAFIIEQRGYHLMQKLILADIKAGIDFPIFKDRKGNLIAQDKRAPYAGARTISYAQPIIQLLEDLKTTNEPARQAVIALLKDFCILEGELGLKQLLPEIH